jgi:hypothetical protein
VADDDLSLRELLLKLEWITEELKHVTAFTNEVNLRSARLLNGGGEASDLRAQRAEIRARGRDLVKQSRALSKRLADWSLDEMTVEANDKKNS